MPGEVRRCYALSRMVRKVQVRSDKVRRGQTRLNKVRGCQERSGYIRKRLANQTRSMEIRGRMMRSRGQRKSGEVDEIRRGQIMSEWSGVVT